MSKKKSAKKKPKRNPANPDNVVIKGAPIDISPEGREVMREFWIKAIARVMFEKYGKTKPDEDDETGAEKEGDKAED
ncbi:MAG: hypothetical protein KTR15_11675 [Phycisphaeraceae bacterium]|nr:hypothetical protein [Phycisphaeraceae bacterium]